MITTEYSEATILITLASLLGGVGSAIWYMGNWINRQFLSMRELIYDKFEELRKNLSDKLEYHEKHDDTRFANIRNDLIRLQMDLLIKENRELKDKTSAQTKEIRDS